MRVFGYGSLINSDSIQKTIDSPKIIGADSLCGYKRVFDFKSPYRKNTNNVYSSVLNLTLAEGVCIKGLVFEIKPNYKNELLKREQGYEILSVTLESGESAFTFIAHNHMPYDFIHHDKVQEEYLKICLEGARKLGAGAYNNFLDTTFISEQSVRDYLCR